MNATLRDRFAHELATLAGLPLSRAQLATLKAFEGIALSERKTFRRLVGSRRAKPNPAGYSVLALQAGRQSGKTRHIIAPLVLRHVLRTVPRSPGETLYVPCVGPTREHVAVLVDAVAAMASALNIPHTRTASEVRFDGLAVVVTVRTANAIAGRSVRSLAVVVDEAAFAGSDTESASLTDREVVAALAPSLVTTGGPILLASTPWARRGYFHQTVTDAHGKARQGDTLAVVAPSWAMNPLATKARTRALATDERRWRREFGAEALDATETALDRDAVTSCVRTGDAGSDPEPGTFYAAGYDHSLGKRDARVLALGHRTEERRDFGMAERFHVARVVVWPAGYDVDRQLSELAEWCRRFRVSRLPCDHFDFSRVDAALRRYGIVAEKRSPSVAEREADHEHALSLFETGRVTIPDDRDLVRELTQDLIVERMPGGRSRVRARRAAGRHDDRFDALSRMLAYARTLPASGGSLRREVRVVRNGDGRVAGLESSWVEVLANGDTVPASPPRGTPEWERAAAERRQRGDYDESDFDADGNIMPLNLPVHH